MSLYKQRKLRLQSLAILIIIIFISGLIADTIRTHCRHNQDSLQTRSGLIADTIRTHCRHNHDSLQTRSGLFAATIRTHCVSIRTHCRHNQDSLQTRSGLIADTILILFLKSDSRSKILVSQKIQGMFINRLSLLNYKNQVF